MQYGLTFDSSPDLTIYFIVLHCCKMNTIPVPETVYFKIFDLCLSWGLKPFSYYWLYIYHYECIISNNSCIAGW